MIEKKGYFILLIVGIAIFLAISAKTDAKTINVPGDYSTIQEAIDAADPGDIIIVENGTYNEQIIIDKDLIIQGQGDTTIIKPSQTTANNFQLFSRKAGGSANTAAIVVVNADATIKNLKIDGSEIGSVPTGANMFVGILYRGVNGTIDSVTVDNINISSGNAIYISSMGKEVNVEVKGCTILNFYKNGITANYEGLTVNIHDNTVTGSGPIATVAQNGIQIGLNAEGIIKNNIVNGKGEYYTGSGWTATGILIYAANATVEGNVVTNAQTGIDVTGDYWGRFSNPWTVYIINNTVDVSNLDASQWAVGIAVATYSDGEIINANIENNQVIGGAASDAGIDIGIAWYGCPGNVIFAVKDNSISNLDYGMYIEGSVGDGSIIQNNTIENNAYGIYLCNDANAANVMIHYNNIMGNSDYGVYSDGIGELDAEFNYWGDATGPYHSSNPDGQGDNVSDNVDFDPWFIKGGNLAQDIPPGENVVDGLDEADVLINVTTTGPNTVYIGQYPDNPAGNLPTGIYGLKYIEIQIGNEDAINWPINITIYYTQEDLDNAGLDENALVGIYHWTGSSWQLYAKTGVNTENVIIDGREYEGFLWALADSLSPQAGGGEDTVPPVTTLTLNPPAYDSWVSLNTQFILTAEDPASGVAHIYYRYWWNGSWYPEPGTGKGKDGNWYEYTGPFSFNEECLHYLEYYAVDNEGNEENVHNETFKVDGTPPTSWLIVGNPKYDLNGTIYVTSNTPFQVLATDYDDGECDVGSWKIYYRIWNESSGWGEWKEGENNTMVEFSIENYYGHTDECKHYIEYYAVDDVGNEEEHHIFEIEVDDTPPLTSKEIGEPKYEVVTGEYFVTSSTPIWLNTTDNKVGCAYLHYEVWWDSDYDNQVDTLLISENVSENQVVIYLPYECLHEIRWYGVDYLGNVENENIQQHRVDNTPPIINKFVGDPKKEVEDGYYITSATPISFIAQDLGICPVDVVKIYYRIWYNGNWTQWFEGTSTTTFTMESVAEETDLPIDEDCIHYIEYYAADALNNTSPIYNETDYVDNTPPYTYKEHDGKIYYDALNDTWYIKPCTPIRLIPVDPGICAINNSTTYWAFYMNGIRHPSDMQDSYGNYGPNDIEVINDEYWFKYDPNRPIHWLENCTHVLEYFSVDALNNSELVKKDCSDDDDPDPNYYLKPAYRYGPDRKPGKAGVDDDNDGQVDEVDEEGSPGSDDFTYRVNQLYGPNGKDDNPAGPAGGDDAFGPDGKPGKAGVDDDGDGNVDVLPDGSWDWDECGWPGSDDGPWGSSWCVPCASASCLWWFADWYNIPALKCGGTIYDLAELLGKKYLNTDPREGTSYGGVNQNWVTGLRKYINDKKVGGRVVVDSDDTPTFNEIKYELERCQDVMLIIRWDGGHAITLSSIGNEEVDPNTGEATPGTGIYRIDFMDPWVGDFVDSYINATDETIWYNDRWCDIDYMVTICPRFNQTYKVDDNPPDTTLETGNPKYYDGAWYVTSQTKIWLNTTDNEIECDVGCLYLHWEAYIWNESIGNWTPVNVLVWNGTAWINKSYGDEYTNNVTIRFKEDCVHKIIYYAVDKVGNVEERYESYFYVDNTPPYTYKEHDGTFIEKEGEELNLHSSYNPLYPIENPISSIWNQPWIDDSYYILEEWADNCDDVLSPCDYIVLKNYPDNTIKVYHVEDLTITLKLKNAEDPTEMIYIEFVGGYEYINETMHNPVETIWYDMPGKSLYTLIEWDDNGNGILSTTDVITLLDKNNVSSSWYIEEISTDMIVKHVFTWAKLCSNITLNTEDRETCLSGVKATYWGYEDEYGNWHPSNPYDFYGSYNEPEDIVELNEYGKPYWYKYDSDRPIHWEEECVHILKYFAVDNLGNKEKLHIQEYRVDGTPPETTIKFEGEYHEKYGKKYIRNDTEIKLIATDHGEEPCIVDDVTIYYRIWYNGTWTDWLSNNTPIESFTMKDIASKTGLPVDKDCKHYIEYYAIDALGNKENANNITVYVDTTPPYIWLEAGEPKFIEDEIYYVTSSTPIWLNASDTCLCPVKNYTIYYRIWYDGEWHEYSGNVNENVSFEFGDFIWSDECIHYLEYYVKDALNNSSPLYNVTFYVDDTPPSTQKEHGDIVVYDEIDDIWYIKPCTPIYLNVSDTGTCAVNNSVVYWGFYMNGIWHPDGTEDEYGSYVATDIVELNEYGQTYWYKYDGDKPIHWQEECVHELYYFAIDALGNKESLHQQTYYVDGTPPIATKKIGLNHSIERDGSIEYYVTSNTWINISGEDTGTSPCIVDDVTVYYRIWYNGEWHGWYSSKSYINFTFGDFNWSDECKHYLEYYVEDALRNRIEVDNETFYVDDTPPEIIKDVGDPSYLHQPDPIWRVTGLTNITISAIDRGCNYTGENLGVGLYNLSYRIWYNGEWSEWIEILPGTIIHFNEDCIHYLEIRAIDLLGHISIDNETFYVDNTVPYSTIVVEDPYDSYDNIYNVSTETNIYLSGYDDGCEPQWRIHYRIDGGEWQIGDWFEVVNIKFATAGQHVLEWYASDGVNNEPIKTAIFNVIYPLNASFTYMPSSPYAQDIVMFIAQENEFVNYTWEFGDGSIGYGNPAIHTYEDPDAYFVNLTITAFDGYPVATHTEVVNVFGPTQPPTEPPVANFSWEQTAPMTITFTDLSYDSDGTIEEWQWDFGDGHAYYMNSTTYTPSIMHVYGAKGTYTVKLLVKDNNGAIGFISKEIEIVNLAPIANFSFSPYNPPEGTPISFNDLSYDLDGYIVNYTWDFGDGNISYEQNPIHIFSQKGRYYVTLTITDNDGAIAEITKEVPVGIIPPVAEFEWYPYNPMPFEEVMFDASASYDEDGYIVNYTWDFGDGSFGYGIIVSHAYAYSGKYNVSLTIRDNHDAITILNKTICVLHEVSFELKLNGWKWNLITIPVRNDSIVYASDLASIIDSDYLQISKWDALNNTWISYIPGNDYSQDFLIEPGVGYFIWSLNNTTVTIVGYPVCEVNITLYAVPPLKWNLIGWFLQNDTNASELANSIPNCKQISIWDSANDTYISYIVGIPESPNPVIKRGMGVAVWVSDPSYWYALDKWGC